MYLWIIYSSIIFILLFVIILLFWKTEIIAPDKKKYPPYKPNAPDNFLPILKEKSCLPSSQTKGICNSNTLQTCNIDMDCDSCRPTQGESYHCVTVDKQNYKLNVNNSSCIVPKGKYCLPDYINKCNPNTSITELVSDGVRQFWSCKCKYNPNLNLFVSPEPGASCDTQIACSNPSGVIHSANRLISRSRPTIPCVPSENDPLCIQKYESNYNEGNNNRFKYPLIYTPVKGVGYKYANWDGSLDGPLVTDKDIPPWETQELNPKCKLNPFDPSCNSLNWGGKCGCDGFVDNNCKDRLKCQTYVPSTLVFKEQSSQWFKCMPDTCWSKENPQGRLNLGKLGENKFGNMPSYLKESIGDCDCGNITRNENGYKSFISKRIGGVPQCIKDPCNPGGYTVIDYTKNPPSYTCVCDFGTYANGGDGYCVDKCSFENNPCQNGSKCSVIGPNREVNCECKGCDQPPYCAQTKQQDGQYCNQSSDCCNGSCMKCDYGKSGQAPKMCIKTNNPYCTKI